MKEETHEFLKRAQIIVAVALLLVSTLMFFNDKDITGNVPADIQSQMIDITADESQRYKLSADSQELLYVSSFKLSGDIIGNGSVEIFLEDNGKQFLVYRNIKKKSQGLTSVTGLAIGPAASFDAGDANKEAGEEAGGRLVLEGKSRLEWKGRPEMSEDETTADGLFDAKCADTCFIEMPLSSDKTYNLQIYVEPGTTLKIKQIIYTLKEENI